MLNEWITSPAFRLTMGPPVVMVAAFASLVEVAPGYGGPGMLIAALGLALAGAAGLAAAVREQRLRQACPDEALADESEASLSAAQAATYRDLFENATDIVFTTDLSGHFLAGNKAVQRLLGYTVEEAKSLTWERLVAPYDMWKARQMYRRHAAGEKRISFELDTVTASGEIKTFEIGSRPMFRDGELCGFHGIARDVTSRKEMEQQLETARREAEAAAQSKSTFLANMSHEIRTPINGMLGFLSLFARTGLSARQKEYLVPVEESARHLLKIINDILDLSKIEAGRFSIDNEIFNFRDAVKSAIDLLRPLGEEKGLVITTSFDPRIPELVVADGTRIGQVVSNLASNAVKFTDAGFVSVQCRLKEAAASNVVVEVAVTDSGIGIEPEQQAILFEPFRQLDSRTNRRYQGTGLGLTISRNLVEAMGGDIRVSSEPGRYTEIVFELPLGRAPESVAGSGRDARTDSRRFAGAGLSALIVDDNEINRRYLEAVLRQFGMQVRQAASGGAALSACRGTRFDIVFMDIHMAGMDGIETTRRLRAQIPAYRAVPVVAVSADVMGGNGRRFTKQGLDHFVAKPATQKDLATLLAQVFPDRAADGDAAVRGGADADPVDGCVLDRERGIELASGDEALWRRSARALQTQLLETMPLIRQAVARSDDDEAGRLAHRLAGSAEYVGAAELAGSARALEKAQAGGDRPPMDKRLREMESAVERYMEIDIDD
ncbi:MAG TPA: ATP-binding protein [Arenicellales bacterium]|nr:ATP-binding protein [Arenicellales bacterium]